MGPAVLGIIHSSSLIQALSEIGVIILMFEAGLDTSISDLKKAGPKAFVIATLGVIIPLIVGYFIGGLYNVGPKAWLGRGYLNGNQCRYYGRNVKRNEMYGNGKWECDSSRCGYR